MDFTDNGNLSDMFSHDCFGFQRTKFSFSISIHIVQFLAKHHFSVEEK